MNKEQFQALLRYCKTLGFKTLGELAKFKEATGSKTNTELLNALREGCRWAS